MKSTLMKLSFNGGELSPLLDGRIDYPKYSSGCKEMTNFIPTVYGPMTKRPGTRFVEDLGSEAVLYPFEFSEAQAYIFAFKEGVIDVYTLDNRLVDDMDVPVSIPSQFTLAEAKVLKFAQTGDLVYFTHPRGGIFKVSRTDVDTFTGESFEPLNGPFQDENIDEELTLQVAPLDAESKEVQILASDTIFTPNDVGSTIKIGYIPSTEFDSWQPAQGTWAVGDYLQYQDRIYEVITGTGAAGTRSPLHEKGTKSDGELELKFISNGYGYAKITEVSTDPTDTVKAEVIKAFPPNIVGDFTEPVQPDYGPESDEWSWGSFGGRFGWPNAIVFHQQRMVLGGSLEQPQTIFGSIQGDVEDFESGVDDDDGYQFTIAANKKNPIAWLASNIILNIGSLGGEFFAGSSGPSITPSDIDIQQIGQYGSSETAAPLIANGFTVFVQAGGRKVRELRFDESSQRNFARDLNKVAEHIADPGIKQIAYQAEPYQIVWVIIGRELYSLTYETDEDVFAWARQSVGNVLSIATIPNNGNDRLWMVVERDGNYYIEWLTKFYRREDSLDDACFVDSSLEYSGPEFQTLTGLDHLEGREVAVFNEGCVGPSRTVENGQITLQFPTTKAIIGLPMKSAWQSMRLEGGSNDGIGQGKTKRVNEVIFRLDNTGAGLTYGKGNLDLDFELNLSTYLPIRDTNDNMDGPPSLLSGDTWRQPIDGGTDPQYMLRVEHSEPVPCTIISIIMGVDTNQ